MDLRRLGLSISEVGASVTYGEAAALVRELARRWDSHYTASVEEWNFVSSYNDVMVASHFEAYLNAHRGEKAKPITVPRPWKDEGGKPTVTDDELEVLVAKLEARSAFRDRD